MFPFDSGHRFWLGQVALFVGMMSAASGRVGEARRFERDSKQYEEDMLWYRERVAAAPAGQPQAEIPLPQPPKHADTIPLPMAVAFMAVAAVLWFPPRKLRESTPPPQPSA